MLEYIINHSPLFYFTQSLWRDEVFSILIAHKSILYYFKNLSFEPPFYYILIHFWIKLFGTGEVAVRSLSFLAFVLATVVVIFWSEKLFKKSWISVFLPIFFFLNPMLIYYAFEIRTYGWYMFFIVLSMFAYTQKRWKIYIAATVLGFYTHTFFLLVFAAQVLHYIIFNFKKLLKSKSLIVLLKDKMIATSLISILLITPWMIKIVLSLGKLKTSWYFPIGRNFLRSVLGNLFLGFEGTPWNMWNYTALLSIILIVFFVIAFINKKTKKSVSYFLISIFAPLIVIIGISYIKPLYVNRYMIFVTISEVFLIGFALYNIKNKLIAKVLATVFLLFIIWFNSWYPLKHPKTPIRDTFAQINKLIGDNDYVYAKSSLIFFESVYYSKNPSRVYLYNPNKSAFPWYVGKAAFDDSSMIYNLPTYPKRAFLVEENGSYSISYIKKDTPVEKMQQ